MKEAQSHNIAFLVTGEAPGSGQSTIASFLAETYQLPRSYVGLIRRQLASVWSDYQQSGMNWEEFEQDLLEDKIDASSINITEKDMDEDQLSFFDNQFAHSQTLSEKIEHIIDGQTAKAILNGPCVAEGKLAVVIDQITDTPDLQSLAYPVIRVLIKAPSAKVRATRIVDREITSSSADEKSMSRNKLIRKTTKKIKKRQKKDWKRYQKLYGVSKKDLLNAPNLIVLDGNDTLEYIYTQLKQEIPLVIQEQ